jgi:hypothetical protein
MLIPVAFVLIIAFVVLALVLFSENIKVRKRSVNLLIQYFPFRQNNYICYLCKKYW